MKALTVRQPWAWAIVHGGKDVENRTQTWSYRGPLAIHAGLRVDAAGGRHPAMQAAMAAANLAEADETPYTLGAIIGVVDLVDVHLCDAETFACCGESPWAEYAVLDRGDGRGVRPYGVHLFLENPRPLAKPIPARGRLGLWDLTAEQDQALVVECLIEGKVP